jgi:hypothetical protein
MKLGSILFTTFALLFSFSMFAQESTVKGGLNGTVVDSTGAVVANAKVTLVGPIGTKTATSNGAGNFAFDLLTPGTYSVRTEASGFKSTEIKAVEVNVNRTSNIRVTLTPGGASEVVEVSAAAAGVDEASTKLETSLNDTFYNQMPVQRNVTGLFYAAAGVNDGGGTGRANPSIGGGSGLENQYVADGVNITDGDFGGIGVFSRMYGPLSTGINLSFVKEVDVKSGGFEPQYGKSTGGIVQIVTKSGSDQYHGGVSAFFGPQQFEVVHPNPDAVRVLNQEGAAIHQGEWDIAGELGGYIPGAQKHVFFFGSFNPTWNRLYNVFGKENGLCAAGACGATTFAGPFAAYPNTAQVTIPSISYDYAAKGTFKLNDNHVIETSLFGDPTHQSKFSPNGGILGGLDEFNQTTFSKLSNGSRNWVARYNATISPTWLFDMSFSWGHNYLTETPFAPNVFQITNNSGASCTVPLPAQLAAAAAGNVGGAACPSQAPNLGYAGTQLTGIYNQQGLGYYEDTKGDNRRLNFDTQKVFNLLGQHTIGIGYSTEWNRYYGTRQATGGGFAVPDPLATNSGLPTGLTDYANSFELDPALSWGFDATNSSALSCCDGVYANVPGNGLTEVVLVQNRGFFSTPQFDSHGRAQAAYAGDSWAIGRHIVFNAGYRWDQEELQGIAYTDPITGIHKQVHYTYTDNWSPRFGLSIDPKGDRKTKIYGSFGRTNYNLPLDMAIRSLGNEEDAEFSFWIPPFTNNNPGTPCGPNNPCMVQFNPDGSIPIMLDAAHSMGGFECPPQCGVPQDPFFLYTATQPGEAIAHGTKMMNLEEEVAGIEHEFPHGILVSLRYQQRHLRRIVEDTSAVSPEAALIGVVQQFQITNPSPTLDIFNNTNEIINPPAGTACAFSGTNVNPFNGATNSVCVTNTNAGFPGSDGQPDGFAQPVRIYKAVEFEVTKAFSRGWQMRTNYRWSTLAGNYEGAFRNDNGQSDPGISSLFDFTPGKLGLLGDQFAIGFLNTDRRHILNNFVSYTFQSGFMKNLTLGTGVRIETGVPINRLRAHPVYQNGGEVPFGGRGALGRTPTAGYGDVHADYSRKVGERSTLHFGADLFNIANQKTQLRIDQFFDASLNVPNADFKAPVGNGNTGVSPAYQRPFNARLFAKWEF